MTSRADPMRSLLGAQITQNWVEARSRVPDHAPHGMRVLRTTLENGGLRRLLAASAAAYLGFWAFAVLFAIYAYDEGGAAAVGFAVLLRQLPAALLTPWIAALADRHPRRSVLLASGAAQTVLMAALAGTIALGGPYPASLGIAAVMAVAAAPFRPAVFALIPHLAATPAQIAGASVTWGMVDYVGFLGGSLAAACLVAPLGLAAAVAASVLPLALGTVALAGLPRDAPDGEDELAPMSAWDELAVGVRTVLANAEMRLLTGFRGADAVVQGTIDVLLVSCAIDLLRTGQSGVGILDGAWGVGGLLGGWLALSLVGRGRLASGVLIGSVCAGVPLALIVVWAVPAPAIAMFILLGVGFAVLEAALNTLLQRQASDTVAARVFGVNEGLYMLGLALGGLVGGMLVSLLGVEGALVVTGLALPALALVMRRRIVGLEVRIEVPERPFTLLRGLEMFAPLPIATIESLAIRSTVMDISAGSAVVRQGDQGDAFYVLDEGALDVFVDRGLVDKRLPGECFGEVALLRDQTRIATVQARSPSRVLVLERQAFLLAVGSHERSMRAADRLADKRTAWAAEQVARQTVAP